MKPVEVRRHRGPVDDVIGGVLTFLLELAIVLGLGLVALALAVLVIAVT